jgi:purine-binding chemotaxis protein CheW
MSSEKERGAEASQYLSFNLGGEIYAMGILAIKEIIEYRGLTTVPMMPECVRGVINLRGAVVPVVDLAARFGGRPSAVTRRTCIVIVEVGEAAQRQDIGVIVDAVNEVMEIDEADIEPAPAFGSGIRSDFIHGMGKVGEGFVIVLEPERVLSATDMAEVAAQPLAA